LKFTGLLKAQSRQAVVAAICGLIALYDKDLLRLRV